MIAEGEDLSNYMTTYPQIGMYSDILDWEEMIITFYLEIGYDEYWENYDECYLTAVMDEYGMPYGFDVSIDWELEGSTCFIDGSFLPFEESGENDGIITLPDGSRYELYD